jgi:hypothetical protein
LLIARGAGAADVDFDASTALAASETAPPEQPFPERFNEFHFHNIIEAAQIIAERANLLAYRDPRQIRPRRPTGNELSLPEKCKIK